jgi:putative transcriptional regulator
VKRLLCIALGVRCTAWAQEVANGVFLVAQPSLTEATFRRTVILITQRPDGGSLGVIVNRPTEIPLREAFPKHEHIAAQTQALNFGGPVQPQALLFKIK